MGTRLAAIFATMIWLSASSAFAQSFERFQAMTFPRANVPVGAKWFPNVGPSGAGAAADNVTTQDGLSEAVFTQSTRASIVGNLGSYLGLSSNLVTTSNTRLGDVSITSVIDYTRLTNVAAGEQVLAQAIRARSIQIVTDANGAAELKAKADARNIPINVALGGSGSRTATLNGSNLYIAYQVVEFTGGQQSERRARHDGQTVTVDGTWQVSFQGIEGGQAFNDGAANVEVVNLRQPSISGGFQTTSFSYRATTDWNRRFALPPLMAGDRITAASIRINYRPTCSDYSQPICVVVFPQSENRVWITTSRFRVRPVSNPRGL